MRILREYVLDSIRRNKRTSLAIMIALFLMTTLMSCFSGFVYTMWTDAVTLSKLENGDWHGELFGGSTGADLEQIENYASVSAVLIKGNWEVAKLDDSGRRTYLLSRGANQEYWESMPEKTAILKGRIPQAADELAVSKQYFDEHQDVKLGDTITLPVGQRIRQGKTCIATDAYHEDEAFVQTGTKTYTLVGVMDVTTSSVVPAYTAMGYLDQSSILPEDELTVYLRFNPMRSTYKELPALAESIGYQTDEYGKYVLKYNTDLLSKYAVFSGEQIQGFGSLSTLAVPLMFLVITALLIGVFVLIIHNAFSLSANERLNQLGTLAGVGASPRQIKSAVSLEALVLLIIPLPLGTLSGWILDIKLFQLINQANDIGRSAPDIVVTFGLPAVIPAVFLSVVTAWISARLPAGKIAKMLPVEALKTVEVLKGKNIRKGRVSHLFGISQELAANALTVRKKSYRTAMVSLCLSFLLFTGFFYIVTVQTASTEVYRAQTESSGHIFMDISDGRPPEQKALDELKNVQGLTKTILYDEMTCATWITRAQASDDIQTYMGGFDEIIAKKKYSPIMRDQKYRIQTVLLGLEKDSFLAYCREIGVDPQNYLSDSSKAIFYNRTSDPEVSTKKENVYRDILKIQTGDTLTFTEKSSDSDSGDHEFQLTAGTLANQLPSSGLSYSRFTLVAIMPMEHVRNIAASCGENKQYASNSVNGIFLTDDSNGISDTVVEKASSDINNILDTYYGSGDYQSSSLVEKNEMMADTTKVMEIIVAFLTGLLGFIGLSNIWACISGNLRQRSQEFAMLKSVGLSPAQLWKMLLLEGITLGMKPVLYSLPFQAAILAGFLHLNEVSLLEYLPFAPFTAVLGYTALVLVAVIAAYWLGGRRIQRTNIITAIKDNTL